MKGLFGGDMKIGIFDSGVGGLSVLKELLEHKPNNEYLYIGDTLNMPYGSKSHEELFICASRIIEYLIKNEVELIIIACGTISSTIYSELKEKYSDVTILDVISPTINYLNNSNYKNVGVIATKNTIESGVFCRSLNGCNIHGLALPKLASIIEHGLPYESYLEDEMKYFDDKNIELLVLGCTHFPIIDEYFKKRYNTFNMATPIIPLINEGVNQKVKVMFTSVNEENTLLIRQILGREDEIIKLNL